ncbi:MAG: dihydrofolate reductase family protein [Micrococcaceae bacterium]
MNKILQWQADVTGVFPLRAAIVSSLNGYTVGNDGTSNSLSNNTDRNFFITLRRSSDLILVGAETVRTEQYKTPKTSSIMVVTNSGVFDSPLYRDLLARKLPIGKVLIKTTDSTKLPVELVEKVGIANIYTEDFPTLIPKLRSNGFHKILCEGGVTLIKQLITSKTLDELLLTLVPKFINGDKTKHLNFEAIFKTQRVHHAQDALFLSLKPY